VLALGGCPGEHTTSLQPAPAPADARSPVERGLALYQSRRCVNCHGAEGLGNLSSGGPRIVGRKTDQLETALVSPCEDPSAIFGCHPVKFPDLTEGQLAELEAYLAALAGNALEDRGPVCDDTPGYICTIAGNGVPGSLPGRQLARDQHLFWPQNVALDPQGRVVITDWNNYMIRRIEAVDCAVVQDGDGRIGLDCPIVNIVGNGGLGDSCSSAGDVIAAADASMNHPVGVLYDDLIPGQSNIILWGWHQWKIKYIPVDADGTTGQMYCLFGNSRGATPDGLPAGSSPNGQDGLTRFNLPSACVYDRARNFYISDQGNLRIRVIRPDGDDDLTSAEAFAASVRNNVVTTFAGGLLDETGNFRRTKPDYSDSGDGGPVSRCTFNVLSGFDAVPQMRLAMDNDRNLLYVADSENHRVRVIDLNVDPPTIDTFAGGGEDVVADYVPATHAKLHRPADVDLVPDGSGDLLITDTFNHCVRYVDFETRTIHTIAGIPGPDEGGYSGDSGPATQARLNEPGGSAIAADGTVYIADTLNHRVRRVNPLGRDARGR
jgi:mono/diheme cytochrome c family protein